MKIDKTTLLIGLLISIVFSFLTYKYIHYVNTASIKRPNSPLLEFFDIADLRFNDIKYKLRSDTKSNAPVALIAIDDASVREIGRWPWSREMMADLTGKVIDLGAKSIAYDAIFSEPEKSNPQADAKFGKVIADHPDKIILGTFSENKFEFAPYQDLCVAEAFLKTGGDQIVKLNASFSIDETNTEFDDLNWASLFASAFKAVEEQTTQQILLSYKKKSVSELSSFQQNNLSSLQASSKFTYCRNWLTAQDFLMRPEYAQPARALYDEVLKDKPELKKLPLQELAQRIRAAYKPHPIPQYGEWTPNIPDLQNPASYTASFIAELDEDGYVRRYPLFFRSGDKLGSSFIPSLALQSYLLSGPYRAELKMKTSAAGEKSIQEFNIYDTSKDPEQKIATYPVDESGQLLLNYYGRQMSLPYVSAKELISDDPIVHVQTGTYNPQTRQVEISTKAYPKTEFFKDRSFIFGATAVGLYDLRNTPLEANYPGPELHLTMLSNLFEKNFLKPWSSEKKLLPWIVLAAGILFSLLWTLIGSLPSLATFVLAVLAYGTFDITMFIKQKILFHSLPLYACLITTFAAIQLYKYFTEERKKRELKSTFSKYVSPSVVDELLKDAENLKLGGRREHMTVFFSDVRGFTTISEKLTPEELSRVLNLYLTPMTEIVFQNNGTLDKYMGDAIMAFFGAPVKHPTHAQEACRCALKSLEKLSELQRQFSQQGLPHIDIGIGINTGDMSVGNMGSNIVQNYTVMGDSVNLASRLEGINKEYGTRIVISEFTYEEVKSSFTAREIDRVRVKGKLEPVRIFELVCEGNPDSEKKFIIENFAKAYRLYHEHQFEEALAIFKTLADKSHNDPTSEVYVERCLEYIEAPPPKDWDGVYVMKTK